MSLRPRHLGWLALVAGGVAAAVALARAGTARCRRSADARRRAQEHCREVVAELPDEPSRSRFEPITEPTRSHDMSLHLGDVAPNFTAATTDGQIDFHDWKGDHWAVFFSHPADFTPVCTTELGRAAGLSDEFARRDTKLIALSVDPLSEHHAWAPDIADVTGNELNFPIIADPDARVARLYDMIHPGEGDSSTVRSVFIIDPDHRIRLTLTYPKSTGRNFPEILRVLDSLQLTTRRELATPADWVAGDRVIVSPSLTTDDARDQFDNVEEIKPYLRYADAPA